MHSVYFMSNENPGFEWLAPTTADRVLAFGASYEPRKTIMSSVTINRLFINFKFYIILLL